jgi:hypothetical protein
VSMLFTGEPDTTVKFVFPPFAVLLVVTAAPSARIAFPASFITALIAKAP